MDNYAQKNLHNAHAYTLGKVLKKTANYPHFVDKGGGHQMW